MANDMIFTEKKNEKPITRMDIANLYSNLQTMMDNGPKSPRLEQPSTVLDRFPLTPSLSTPLPSDCPCRHIFISKDSEHCGLCDELIPALADIQHDRESKRQEVQELQQTISQLETELAHTGTLQQELQHLTDTLHLTRNQLSALKEQLRQGEARYQAEQIKTAEAHQAKLNVENELEELSQKLFEEANGMVAQEKRERHALEVQNRQLQKELEVYRGCVVRTEPDEIVFREFQEFLDIDRAMTMRWVHVMSPFMRQCYQGDVEPCLRFSSKFKWTAKKVSEVALIRGLLLEEIPKKKERPTERPVKLSPSKSTFWDRLTPGGIHDGCQVCGRETNDLPYRFRLSPQDEWLNVDRFCRDRLMAVDQFYGFLRKVRQGAFEGQSATDLFQELCQYKLQLFYAKMGLLQPKSNSQVQTSESNANIQPSTSSRSSTPVTLVDQSPSNSTEELEIKHEENKCSHPVNSVWMNL